MKRKILAMLLALSTVLSLCACSASNDGTVAGEEARLIKQANEIVSREYGTTFEEGDFSYSVGAQVKGNKFLSLDVYEEGDDIRQSKIAVSALKKSQHGKGELYSYSLVFDPETSEIEQISADFG